MKKILYEWIRNVAYYMILTGIIINILPNAKYEKYVRLVTGIILIIMMVNPILKLTDFERWLDISLVKNLYEQEITNESLKILEISKEQREKIFDKYKNEISSDIEEIIMDCGYYAYEIIIEMQEDENSPEYGKIMAITITAGKEKESDISKREINIEKIIINDKNEKKEYESHDSLKIKKTVANFYNFSIENINVNIQR